MVNCDNICGAEGVGKISCLYKNRGWKGGLKSSSLRNVFFDPLITKVKEGAVI